MVDKDPLPTGVISFDFSKVGRFVARINRAAGSEVLDLNDLSPSSVFKLIRRGMSRSRDPKRTEAELRAYVGDLTIPQETTGQASTRSRSTADKTVRRSAEWIAEELTTSTQHVESRGVEIRQQDLLASVARINRNLEELDIPGTFDITFNADSVETLLWLFETSKPSAYAKLSVASTVDRYLGLLSGLSDEQIGQQVTPAVSGQQVRESVVSLEKRIAHRLAGRYLSRQAREQSDTLKEIDVTTHDAIIDAINCDTVSDSVRFPRRDVDYAYFESLVMAATSKERRIANSREFFLEFLAGASYSDIARLRESSRGDIRRSTMFTIQKMKQRFHEDIGRRMESISPLEMIFPAIGKKEAITAQFLSNEGLRRLFEAADSSQSLSSSGTQARQLVLYLAKYSNIDSVQNSHQQIIPRQDIMSLIEKIRVTPGNEQVGQNLKEQLARMDS